MKTPIKWRLLLFGPLPLSLCPYPMLARLSWKGLILKGSGTGLRDKSSKGIGNLQVTELRTEASDCTGALCAYAEEESHPVVPRLGSRLSAVRLAIHEQSDHNFRMTFGANHAPLCRKRGPCKGGGHTRAFTSLDEKQLNSNLLSSCS